MCALNYIYEIDWIVGQKIIWNDAGWVQKILHKG